MEITYCILSEIARAKNNWNFHIRLFCNIFYLNKTEDAFYIGLLISVFYIGLVIASRSVVLAWGEAEGQYDRPRRNN